ncbi:MAG: NAD-binding protein [Polyangiaceae bacterium]|nr:NAD-binding protein [Polyangiaceae bacterium]
MPLTPRVERLKLPRSRRSVLSWALWREWCFAKALGRRLGLRLVVFVVLLLVGGLLFRHYEPDRVSSYVQAVYFSLSLVFGEPPEEFPSVVVLQALFFVLPLLGLTVLIESVVEVANVLRDRRSNDRVWSEIMAESLSNHVVLVGLGRVGYRTYRALHGLGVPLVVIDVNKDGEFLSDVRRDGTPIIIGDARREALLITAGVERAAAILAATNDDLANLEVVLDAKQRNPGIRVVIRMFDQNMADKVQAGFGIQAALSSTALSAPTFAAAAVVPHLVASSLLDDRLVLMVNRVIRDGESWCGRTLAELAEAHRIAFVRRTPPSGETQMFPPPSTKLGAGDVVVVEGVYEDLVSLAVA